ncbi:MAG: acyl-CoA dehydratase activase [Cetobacterium sp.]|uniref:acyl-CoA dehydratase activase n=1 Tax=Cetobacterium sp. TaxID=2071632 RepID=UPI003F2CA909
MIGYMCKYTPKAIFEGFNISAERIEPSITNFDYSDSISHPNLCAYSKALIQDSQNSKYEGIILVNCCDSIRRAYDILKSNKTFKFIHLLDLPRKNNCCSKNIYANELLKLIKYLESFYNKEFSIKSFKNALNTSSHVNTPEIVLMGARIKNTTFESIQNMTHLRTNNETCAGQEIYFQTIPKTNDLETLIKWYAEELLSQTSCMRMENISNRKKLYESPILKGIIYHSLKFCDYYSLEYLELKSKLNIPILKIETDFTEQSEGQIKTRVEAFLESMNTNTVSNNKKNLNKKNFYVAGIDSGSTSTNVVIMNDKKEIISSSIVKTGPKCTIGAEEAMKVALEAANLKEIDISFSVATGYGRVSIGYGNEDITEITCHAKGANFLNPNVRTIIDIGGQDSKAIKIDENGDVKDFVMNDKCAAGTGRFLDVMSRSLELTIEKMSELGLKWNEEIKISSMCSVFAESEVISLIAENKELADIIHGLNEAIASRTVALVNRIGKTPQYMMTGGVAKNKGVVKAIEEKLGEKLFIWDEPQICGAIGAALIAYNKFQELI